jgi:hypothetical protein
MQRLGQSLEQGEEKEKIYTSFPDARKRIDCPGDRESTSLGSR